jgi:hypothetical protein
MNSPGVAQDIFRTCHLPYRLKHRWPMYFECLGDASQWSLGHFSHPAHPRFAKAIIYLAPIGSAKIM